MKHPGRKLYHLAGGLGMLSLYFILGRERAMIIYSVLFVLAMGFDIARLSIPAFNDFVFSRFHSFIRQSERRRITGTPPYVLGIAFSLYFYSTPIATTAICFLACGDVAATAIGERYGRTKIGQKSLEGTAGFVCAALLAGSALLFLGWGAGFWLMLFGALAAAGLELLPLPINDNLVIPVVSGGLMELALRYFPLIR